MTARPLWPSGKEEKNRSDYFSFWVQKGDREENDTRQDLSLEAEASELICRRKQPTISNRQKQFMFNFKERSDYKQSDDKRKEIKQELQGLTAEQQSFYNSYFDLSSSGFEFDHLQRDQATCSSDQLDDEKWTFCQDPNQLEQFITDMDRRDITFLRTVEKKLLKSFRTIIQHWNIFKFQLEPLFTRLIDTMRFHLVSQKFQKKIYHKTFKLIDRLERLYEYKGSPQNIVYGKPLMDSLYRHYIEEILTRNSRKGLYRIQNENEMIPIQDYIQRVEEFLNNPEWFDIFFLGYHFILEDYYLYYNDFSLLRQKYLHFSNKIYKIPSVSCQDNKNPTFFYQNQTIFDQQINQNVISMLGGIEHLDQNMAESIFFKEVTALLNSEGGIALWNCKRKYLEVWPIGEVLTDNEKIEIKRKVKKLLNKITPKVKLGVDCDLQFIPVAQHPRNYKMKEKPIFKEGYYVPILKVFKRNLNSEMYCQGHYSKFFVKLNSLIKPIVIQKNNDLFLERQRMLSYQKIESSNQDLQIINNYIQTTFLKFNDQVSFKIPLFQEIEEEIENFILQKPSSYHKLKKSFEIVAEILQNDISILMLDSGQLSDNQKRVFKLLISLLKKVEEILKEIEDMMEFYTQDKKHCYKTSQGTEEVERHYNALIETYQEKREALMSCREKIVEKCLYFSTQIYRQCKQVEVGNPLKRKRNIDLQIQGNPENIFKFATVLICQRANVPSISKKLMNNGIQCIIKHLPSTNKFRGVENSSVIYHNCHYSQLSTLIRGNKDFYFNGKPIIIGQLTKYIQLISRSRANELSFDDFKLYQQCLKSMFTQETLTMWKYISQNGEIEYYLSTSTRISTLFVYLIINHYGQKGLIKNIPGITDPNKSYKDLSQIYPKK